jgi:hypothetical protein
MIVGSCITRRKETVLTNQKKINGDGKVVIVSSYNSDDECLAVFAACVSRDDEWILDIACLLHISYNEDWFSSHEYVETGILCVWGMTTLVIFFALVLFRSGHMMA